MARTRDLFTWPTAPDIMESSRLFGENPGLVIINPARSIRPWFCVPEGSYALVQSFGQYQKYNKSGSYVWPAGFHWATYWHFTRVATLVTKQSIVLLYSLALMPCIRVLTMSNGLLAKRQSEGVT